MKISPQLLKRVVVSLICIAVVSCNDSTDEALKQPVNDSTTTLIDLGVLPKISVRVTMDDSVFKVGDDPGFRLTIVNTSDTIQKILFDKPALSFGVPWHTTADVKSLDPGDAKLDYMQNVNMSSQAYMAEELDPYDYELIPGDSVSGHYTLSNIIGLKSANNRLAKGTYQITFYHAGTRANEVVVVRIE